MDAEHRDFFVSHASPDQAWAEWVAVRLEQSGYRVELDVWDWTAGQDFVTAMETALRRARRVIAVYSEEYFKRPFASVEHRTAFSHASKAGEPRLIPILIEPCEIPELYQTLIRIDLINVDEATASRRLLQGVAVGRRSRPYEVTYPGAVDVLPMAQSGTSYPGSRPEVWRMPPRNPFFVGRGSALRQIDSLLRHGRDRKRAIAVVSVQGMGGIGKTQIVNEYGHRCAGDYKIIWWIDADSPDLIAQGLMSLADELSVTASSPERTIEKLWTELSCRVDWLLIYDNVDNPGSLSNLRPPAGGTWLITSRNPAIERVAQMIEIREFERGESLQLLEQRVPALSGAHADRVAEALGDLPLAVEQAAYYLQDTDYDADDYLPILLQQPGSAGLSDATIDRHPGLIQVVQTSLLRLEKNRPTVAHVLKVLALLAPEMIPIVPRGSDDLAPGIFGVCFGNRIFTAELVRDLSSSGLIRRLGRSIQMHRLVQLVLVSNTSEEDLKVLAEDAAKLLSTAGPGDTTDPQDWPKYAVLLPHVQALVERRPSAGWTSVEGFRELVLKQIGYLYRAGRYATGLALAENGEPVWQEDLGEHHKVVLRLRNNKGMCLTGLRRFVEATALYRDLVSRYSETLGPSDPLTLRAGNNVGVTLSGDGKYSDAVKVLSETVERMRAKLGSDHIETLRTSDNLVEALTGMADYARAIEFAEQTLACRQRLFPANHPDTLGSAHNLGAALRFVDRDRARIILDDALERRKATLGTDHPDTVHTRELIERM